MTPPGSLPEVQVLLATCNGARFLVEQIDSLLAQDYPHLTILASDDASADDTPRILEHYALLHPQRFHILRHQQPSGSARNNFLRLMQAATAAYVCFADQDDIWLAGKVSRSMAAMQALERETAANIPLLVFTDLTIVDEQLQPQHASFWRFTDITPRNSNRLARALGHNPVTGCTALINLPMLALARRMPSAATMHDRWIGLLAASLGKAAWLPEATVLYRQHAANVVGARQVDSTPGGLARRATHLKPRLAERLRTESQAAALLALHGDAMPEKHRALLANFLRSGQSASPFARVALTLRHGFFRGGLLKSLATLVDVALHRSAF